MDNNQWHQAKVPFFLEVEYYDEYNSEAEDKIMRSLLRGEDVLPGLRVNKNTITISKGTPAHIKSMKGTLDPMNTVLQIKDIVIELLITI